jgi:hypothetical protein
MIYSNLTAVSISFGSGQGSSVRDLFGSGKQRLDFERDREDILGRGY